MMTGIVIPSSRSVRVMRQPSSPGSIRSITTTSGRSKRILRSARSPSSAHSTSMPARRRWVIIARAITASSSASSTLGIRRDSRGVPGVPRPDQRFAAPACLSSPDRTSFRVTSTAHPPGFDLLGCPRRRREKARGPAPGAQAGNWRTLRGSTTDARATSRKVRCCSATGGQPHGARPRSGPGPGRSPRSEQSPRALEDFAVAVVRDRRHSLVDPEPAHLVDIVRQRAAAVVGGHQVVPHGLRPRLDVIADRPQVALDRAGVPGLLLDLPDGGLAVVLPGVELALGQRPVVVLRAVDDGDQAVAVQDRAGRPDHPRTPARRRPAIARSHITSPTPPTRKSTYPAKTHRIPRSPWSTAPNAIIAMPSTPNAWVSTHGPGRPIGVTAVDAALRRRGSASSLLRLRRASPTTPTKTARKYTTCDQNDPTQSTRYVKTTMRTTAAAVPPTARAIDVGQ